MAKFPTYPKLYGEVLQINLSYLKRNGFLVPGHTVSGVLSWSKGGRKTGSVSIMGNMEGAQPFIELKYSYNDEPRNYKISLVSVPSNLGKGEITFFLCPATNKRCRKLYSIGGYFLHREAFSGCMYECQTKSKQSRQMDKHYGVFFDMDKLFEQLNSKYFTPFYSGKPTKKYSKIMRKLNNAKQI